MCVYLRAKFEVSIIILTSFRQKRGGGEGGRAILPPTSKQTPKKPTQIRVKKYRGVVSWKILCFQKWHKKFGEFSHK